MVRIAKAIRATLALFVVCVPCWLVESQDNVFSVPLTAAQTKLERLAPDKASGEATFVIDIGQLITFQITATADIDVAIQVPSGQIVTGDNIDSINGSFANFESQEGDDSILALAPAAGFHYIFTFPSQGVGSYTAHFNAGPSLEQEVAVSTIVMTDSPVKTALITAIPVLELGGIQVVSAFVFEGSVPLVGADVSVRVRSETDTLEILELLDSGADSDDVAGDGIYSALLVPSEAGRHSVVARIEGTTSDGTPFSRENAAEFEVFGPKSRIVRLVDDRAVDDDADGVFNRVALQIETDTADPGRYELFVKLASAAGKTVVRKSELELVEGLQSHAVSFEGEAIIGLQDDGPFDIVLLRLDFVGEAETFTVHSLDEVVQTRPYLLTQFEPAVPGTITGIVTNEQNAKGLPNVTVSAHDVNGDFVGETITEDSGSYVLKGLNPGNYFVFTGNGLGFVDEIYLDKPCAGPCEGPDEAGTPVKVSPGRVTTSIDFALRQ